MRRFSGVHKTYQSHWVFFIGLLVRTRLELDWPSFRTAEYRWSLEVVVVALVA